MSIKRRTLITGASSGLGMELALLMASKGHSLVLVARNEGRLLSLKSYLEREYKVGVDVFPIDLTLKESTQKLYDFVRLNNFEIDILVNNAGFGDFGPFSTSELKKQREMIALNVSAVVDLCHLFLPEMIHFKQGRILNVASIAAFQPGPYMSIYYATKAFVLSFSEALATELQGTGVSVTALCPGPIRTGFEERADLTSSGLFKNLKVTTPDAVARFGYAAMMRGQVVAIHGVWNRLLVFPSRFMPRSWVRKTVRRIQA
ncbi:MAG: SDR family oxidoreductase [Porphyromonas sp.]|nr:SDR family oxidoreductase [Porphyromonas sp.]